MLRTRRSGRSPAVESLEHRTLFSAGNLDPSFSDDGVALLDVRLRDGGSDVVVQPDGKVVVAGSTWTSDADHDFVVARFNADGTPDRTFGNGGVVVTDFDGGLDVARGVGLLPDGSIVVAGVTVPEPTSSGLWAVARYTTDGLLDPGFGGGDGRMTVDLAGGAYRLAVQPDGRAVVVGATSLRGFGVARFDANGLDDSFGDGGVVTTSFGRTNDIDTSIATAVDVAGDGRIVVGGWSGAVARYLPDGRLDPTFSGDGRSVDWRYGAVEGVSVQTNGKIIVLRGDLTLTRLKPGGGVDPTFGPAGYCTVPAAGPDQRPFSRDLARQPDGKILVSGFTSNTRTDTTDVPQMILARVTPDGELDPSFGDGGVARFAYYPGGLYRSFGGLAVAPDGKILAAGDVQRPPGDDLAVYRFLGDAVQPPPPPPPPAEVWTIQAEDADALGGTVVATNHAGYTGRGFIDFIGNSGAGAGWTINDTPGAGTYTIEFRYANGSDAARDMTLDASPARPVGPVSFAPTGGWAKWATKTVTVTMAQGIPTLEFSLATTGQNGPNIDSIKVSYQPLAGEDQQYQAEQARLVGARALSSHAGFTGTGYADFTNASGDSIEWDVSPHEGGRHEIVFRYANGAASDRPLQLSLNGDVITGRLSFAPTGSWSTWREISMEVNLADAGNRLRLATVGNNGPNIDVLTVRPLQ